MSIATKHRKAKVGDAAVFDGEPLIIAQVDGDAFTLTNAERSTFVGVHRKDKRLRVAPNG
jgi:hypothetical protein